MQKTVKPILVAVMLSVAGSSVLIETAQAGIVKKAVVGGAVYGAYHHHKKHKAKKAAKQAAKAQQQQTQQPAPAQK